MLSMLSSNLSNTPRILGLSTRTFFSNRLLVHFSDRVTGYSMLLQNRNFILTEQFYPRYSHSGIF